MTQRRLRLGGLWLAALTLVGALAARNDGDGQGAQGLDQGAPTIEAPPAPSSAPVQAPPWTPERIDQEARVLPRLHSLLVSRRGELLFERYYNGIRSDRPANIKSASKSIISTLVGIAIG